MSSTTRGKGLLIGAAALAFGALALWLTWSPVRRIDRDALVSAPPILLFGRDATTETDAVEPVSHEREEVRQPDVPGVRGKALRVDVVDASGRPAAGVSIACGIVSSSRPGVFEERLRTRSDDQGSAWIELSELPDPTASSTASPDASLRLRAEILAQPVPEIALDRGVVGAEPIVLRLPPTGSVRLEVEGAHGRSTPSPVRFAVWARTEGAARDVEPLPRWVSAPDGVAVLEHVGLGLELRVAAAVDGDRAQAERVRSSGPRFSGEERTVSVPLGAEWPTVLLRALDEHGDPLRNEILGSELRWSRPGVDPTSSSDAGRSRPVRTDDDGRVRLPLPGSVAGGYARRLVLTHREGADEGAGGAQRAAERDLSWDAAAGTEIELGDVELRPLEKEADVVWVSGIVTGPAGDPVATATVLVSAVTPDGASVRGLAAKVPVEPDGSFVVTGPPIAHRLSVGAVAPGFLRGAEDVVVPGASGLHVGMQTAARWAGRLRLDPGIPPESLVVEVITPERRRRMGLVSERIAMDGLDAAWVDVEVRTRTGDWLVERWERRPTFSAGTPSEASEDDLDLRGRLRRLRLRITDSDGTALDRVFARVHPEPWPEGGGWIHGGCLELLVPGEARRILVRPGGHLPIAVEPLDGLQELTCAPGIAGGA